ncbi:MAG: putative ABC transport system permease protein, partial [Gammaproteobacteria bacterium]
RAYSIVGVVPDQNFLGFHNVIKPMAFMMRPAWYSIASLRVEGSNIKSTMGEIEKAWEDVIPDYPIQVEYLDETFNEVFKVFNAMTKTLGGFAFLAITLSMVGLFGMSAFMVERRTKEIGIRKVMGANLRQIVGLLIWQFSKPVLCSLAVALPAAYLASNTYLNFFADRLSLPVVIIISAGLAATLFSWAIISFHSIKIARANPIRSLRYE